MNKELIKDKYHDAGFRPRNTDKRKRKSKNTSDFFIELGELINKHSMESASDTPDFILAQYLSSCLLAWNQATMQRETWYGRKTKNPET